MFLRIDCMTLDQIGKLEELLPPEAMPLPMIEGLYAGLLGGPKIPPMAKVFEVTLGALSLNNEAQANDIFAALIDWWNGISAALLPVRDGTWRGGELPLLGQRIGTGVHSALDQEGKQDERLMLAQWVHGFGLAMQYAPTEWSKLAFETDLLTPLMCVRASNWFEGDETAAEADGHLEFLTDKQIDLIADYLPELVIEATHQFIPTARSPMTDRSHRSQSDKNRAKRDRKRHR
jgi:hypothetical protein